MGAGGKVTFSPTHVALSLKRHRAVRYVENGDDCSRHSNSGKYM